MALPQNLETAGTRGDRKRRDRTRSATCHPRQRSTPRVRVGRSGSTDRPTGRDRRVRVVRRSNVGPPSGLGQRVHKGSSTAAGNSGSGSSITSGNPIGRLITVTLGDNRFLVPALLLLALLCLILGPLLYMYPSRETVTAAAGTEPDGGGGGGPPPTRSADGLPTSPRGKHDEVPIRPTTRRARARTRCRRATRREHPVAGLRVHHVLGTADPAGPGKPAFSPLASVKRSGAGWPSRGWPGCSSADWVC